jgi:23S rRNA pseudouridine1911/1915/1917 synthase
VHLASIDLPVSGDTVYGRPADLGLQRQFLHASRLTFTHPMTAATVDVSSPLPSDLVEALERAA